MLTPPIYMLASPKQRMKHDIGGLSLKTATTPKQATQEEVHNVSGALLNKPATNGHTPNNTATPP